MEENLPSYYGRVPAEVRYDHRLCPNAKLMYCELSALSQKEGYCWATNSYFAKLYNVSKTAVSGWISLLKKYGYITVEMIYEEGTKHIKQRLIYVHDTCIDIQDTCIPVQDTCIPIKENFTDNNISNKVSNISSTIPDLDNCSTTEVVLVDPSNIYKGAPRPPIEGFEIPTLAQVEQAAKEFNLTNVNPKEFFDRYTIANWKDKAGNIFDWKIKLYDWNRRQLKTETTKTSPSRGKSLSNSLKW